jgi:predicted DCC family thiol-disulfide oxidoreductase YuxK
MIDSKKNVIFYDGDCGLCHSCILFILPRMKKLQPFYFASQKGLAFRELKNDFPKTKFPDSIALYIQSKGEIFFKVEAVSIILTSLKWPWVLIGILLKIIPFRISNYFYDLIARRRRSLFKKTGNLCNLISKESRQFFLED